MNKEVIKVLKIYIIGTIFAGIPLWLAISYIDIFIKLSMLFIVGGGIFGMGLIISNSNEKLYKWVENINE